MIEDKKLSDSEYAEASKKVLAQLAELCEYFDFVPKCVSIFAECGIRRACQQAGIRQITWHTLRHTFASQLVTEGVPINVVQTLLGHSTVVMTMKYAHLAPSALHEAVSVLERAEMREVAQECHYRVTTEPLLLQVSD
jgi:integrase